MEVRQSLLVLVVISAVSTFVLLSYLAGSDLRVSVFSMVNLDFMAVAAVLVTGTLVISLFAYQRYKRLMDHHLHDLIGRDVEIETQRSDLEEALTQCRKDFQMTINEINSKHEQEMLAQAFEHLTVRQEMHSKLSFLLEKYTDHKFKDEKQQYFSVVSKLMAKDFYNVAKSQSVALMPQLTDAEDMPVIYNNVLSPVALHHIITLLGQYNFGQLITREYIESKAKPGADESPKSDAQRLLIDTALLLTQETLPSGLIQMGNDPTSEKIGPFNLALDDDIDPIEINPIHLYLVYHNLLLSVLSSERDAQSPVFVQLKNRSDRIRLKVWSQSAVDNTDAMAQLGYLESLRDENNARKSLGAYIVRQVVEAYGGSVYWDPVINFDYRFELNLSKDSRLTSVEIQVTPIPTALEEAQRFLVTYNIDGSGQLKEEVSADDDSWRGIALGIPASEEPIDRAFIIGKLELGEGKSINHREAIPLTDDVNILQIDDPFALFIPRFKVIVDAKNWAIKLVLFDRRGVLTTVSLPRVPLKALELKNREQERRVEELMAEDGQGKRSASVRS